jgi:hypothetical protein
MPTAMGNRRVHLGKRLVVEGLAMRRRRLLLIVGALALISLVGLLLASAFLPPEPGVTWENFQEIHEGMMEEEVETIIGGRGETSSPSPEDKIPKGAVRKEWRGEFTDVFVIFDQNGAVIAKGPSFVESGAWMEPRRSRIWSRIRRLLSW